MDRQKTLMVNSEQKELIDNKDISTVSGNAGGYMGTESSWNSVNDISLEEKGRSLLKVISIISIVEGSIVGIFFILLMLTLLLDFDSSIFNTSILLCICAGIPLASGILGIKKKRDLRDCGIVLNAILVVFLIIIIMASRTLTDLLMFSITIIVCVLYIIAGVTNIRNMSSKENNMPVYLTDKRKATRKCNRCGAESDTKFCPVCGNEVTKEILHIKYCTSCNVAFDDTHSFCNRCGQVLNEKEIVKPLVEEGKCHKEKFANARIGEICTSIIKNLNMKAKICIGIVILICIIGLIAICLQ